MKKYWLIALLIIIFSAVIFRYCAMQHKPDTLPDTTVEWTETAIGTNVPERSDVTVYPPEAYYNTDTIKGSFNATDNPAVPLERIGLIRSETGVDMQSALWNSSYSASSTLSFESDLDGDGMDEDIDIDYFDDTKTIGVFLYMDDKVVELDMLASKDFFDAATEISGDANGLATELDVACADLDDDCFKEIILAYGNDNGGLVISLLKYTGGEFLYEEAGGIKGTKGLRYIVVTAKNSLYTGLFFNHPAALDAPPTDYVEYGYTEGALELIGYKVSGEKMGMQNDTGADLTGVEASIVGQWSAHEVFDTFQTSWDFQIIFNKDRTYSYVTAATGLSRLEENGKFKVEGDKIIFFADDGTETVKQFKFVNSDRISIEWTAYERVK